MRATRAAVAGVVAVCAVAAVGILVAVGGGRGDGDDDASPPTSSDRSDAAPGAGAPSGSGGAVAPVQLTHFPPGALTTGSQMTVPMIPLCPKPQTTPACIDRAEAVVTSGGTTTRRDLPFDPNQGYLVEFEPSRAGELRYYLELTLSDGRVQRLPKAAPDEQFTVPITDGGFRVALPKTASAAKAVTSHRLPWGSGVGQVGSFDGHEGDDGGPAGFGVMSDGTVVVGDYINSRLSVIEADGAARATRLAPDQRGTFVKDEAADAGLVLGSKVSSVSADGRITRSTPAPNGRVDSTPPGGAVLDHGRLWLRDDTSRWLPVGDDGRLGKALDTDAAPTPEAAAAATSASRTSRTSSSSKAADPSAKTVSVEVRNGPVQLAVTDADGRTTRWDLQVPGGVGGVLSTEVTDTGDIVVAVATIESGGGPGHAWIARLTPDGRYGTSYVEAPWEYMVNGPQLQIDDSSFHVMSGDGDGLRVDSYPLPAATRRAS